MKRKILNTDSLFENFGSSLKEVVTNSVIKISDISVTDIFSALTGKNLSNLQSKYSSMLMQLIGDSKSLKVMKTLSNATSGNITEILDNIKDVIFGDELDEEDVDETDETRA